MNIPQNYPSVQDSIPHTFISKADINITYNYSDFYEETYGKHGIRILDGMPILIAKPILRLGISRLGRMKSANYFDKHKGNAGAALDEIKLLIKHAAHFHPNGDLHLQIVN